MEKIMKKLSLTMALALALPTAALAQYTGPSRLTTTTVKQLLDDGKGGQYATLRGFIVSHEGGRHYTFLDDTGHMKMEIKNKLFPPSVKIDSKVRVEVSGKFDKGLMGTKNKLEVKQLSLAP